MSTTSKNDEYPKSLKVITIAGQSPCNNRFFLRAYPPEDLLETKELYTRIVFRFEPSIDSSLQKISKVGVASNYPLIQTDPADVANYIDKEFVADSTGLIDISLDLTALIVNPTGDNFVEVQFPDDFIFQQGYGRFLHWQVDLVHTTVGVRSKTA